MGGIAQGRLVRKGNSVISTRVPVEPQMDVIAPMLAGARARGIADAFEMMGAGIVMLNQSGRVLYASPRACALMQDAVSIASEHLVGASAETNCAIQSLIESCLLGPVDGHPGVTISGTGQAFRIRPLPLPAGESSDVQLLKIVLSVTCL